MDHSSERWIRLAHILRPQGRKGEVLADLYTDFPEQFATQPSLSLAPDGFAEKSENGMASGAVEPARLIAHWLPVGRNAGRVVLQFEGISSIEQAETLAGKELVIPASERRALEDGSVYVSDLIGVTVHDGDQPIGVVTEVLFPATPDGSRKVEDAVPLLSLSSADGDEILVPFASAYVEDLDLPAKILRMALPEGLTEINRTRSTDPHQEPSQTEPPI